jgi:hypothetical protein
MSSKQLTPRIQLLAIPISEKGFGARMNRGKRGGGAAGRDGKTEQRPKKVGLPFLLRQH